MNFETVLRCLYRLEHLRRTSSDLRCRPLCQLFVLLSLWRHGRLAACCQSLAVYGANTIWRYSDLGNRIATTHSHKVRDFSVDLHMARAIARHKIRHLKLSTRKLEDLHV